MGTPLAPSDTVENLVDFLERNRNIWGFARDVFVDSADQATLTEFAKYKQSRGCIYNGVPAWKKMPIIDRINTQLGWLAHGDFLVVNGCTHYISELNTYSWREEKDNTPEDGHDHMINSVQYAFIPYKTKIGGSYGSR
jgi:hypothetical protein